jgi:hypothetical protein
VAGSGWKASVVVRQSVVWSHQSSGTLPTLQALVPTEYPRQSSPPVP